jgi:hypothetical protein
MDYLDKYSPQMPSIFSQFEPDTKLEESDYVFDVYQKLLFAKRSHEVLFLVIGKLLKEIRDKKLYKKLDYENFGQFLGSEEIAFSRESAFLYIRVFDFYIEHLQLTEGVVSEINVSRLSLMLPILKKIENKEDCIKKIEELNTMRNKDFMLEVKKETRDDRPSVYFSQEIDKWIVQYYPSKTQLFEIEEKV